MREGDGFSQNAGLGTIFATAQGRGGRGQKKNVIPKNEFSEGKNLPFLALGEGLGGGNFSARGGSRVSFGG